MKTHTIGRALGIGLRISGRVAARIMAGDSNSATSQPVDGAADRERAVGRAAALTTKGVARGLGAFLRPFCRVGGIVWLEVTGVFFFLPVVYYLPSLWRTRASYAHGPDHHTFLLSALVVAVFLYLGITSFWRAGKR
jgi:hypothetical protein